MFDIGKTLADYGMRAKTWVDENPNNASVLFGNLAGAVMGGSPEGQGSWQTGVGNAMSQWGQSGIAAAEKKKQEEQRGQYNKMFNQVIMDMIHGNNRPEMTPAEKGGLTGLKMKAGPDGQYQLVLDVTDGDQTPTGVGEVAVPQQPASQRAPQSPPVQNSERANFGRLLPFLWAGQGGEGTGVNLQGLNPQLIAQLAQQSQQEQQIRNQTMGEIYDSMNKQALSEYYDRLPQASRPTFRDWKWSGDISDSGNYVLYNEDGETKEGPKAHKSATEGKGQGTFGLREIVTQNRDGTYSTQWVQTGSRAGAGTVYPGSGEPTISQREEKRAVSIDPKVAEAQANIAADNSEKSSGDVSYYHEHAPNSATRFYRFQPNPWYAPGEGKYVLTDIPKEGGGTATMGEVRSAAKELSEQAERPVTVPEVLESLYKMYGKKE